MTAIQLLHRARRRVSGWPVAEAVDWAARIGYGARGFVYLSVGVLILLASLDQIGSAVGSSGAAGWLAGQPLGRVWLILLGLGLWLFVLWRGSAMRRAASPTCHWPSSSPWPASAPMSAR